MSFGPYPALVMPMSPWACPRCGKSLELGSKRSLWSLLPVVCRHLAVDYTGYYEKMRQSSPGFDVDSQIKNAGFEQREVYQRPVPADEKGLRRKFRDRLKDELQERRPAWWRPLYSEEVDQRRQFRSELRHEPQLVGSEEAVRTVLEPEENTAPWGPW